MSKKSPLNNEVLNLLERLGLNQYESKVYTSLLLAGTATAGELSEVAGVPRSRVYDVLTSLEKKGFAIIQLGRPVKYVAVPVESAINQVRAGYEEDYNKKLKYVEKLHTDLQKSIENTIGQNKFAGGEPTIRIIKGKSNLYSHINKLTESSDSRILKMTNDYGLSNLDKYSRKSFEKAKKRGVEMKILANIKDAPDTKHIHRLAEIRKGEHKGRFMVKDGKEAILVTSQDDSGIWVDSQYLASSLESLFEHAWKSGKSF